MQVGLRTQPPQSDGSKMSRAWSSQPSRCSGQCQAAFSISGRSDHKRFDGLFRSSMPTRFSCQFLFSAAGCDPCPPACQSICSSRHENHFLIFALGTTDKPITTDPQPPVRTRLPMIANKTSCNLDHKVIKRFLAHWALSWNEHYDGIHKLLKVDSPTPSQAFHWGD